MIRGAWRRSCGRCIKSLSLPAFHRLCVASSTPHSRFFPNQDSMAMPAKPRFGPYAPPVGGAIEVTILVKAATEWSKKYGETVCTAAILDDGRLVRLYPGPIDEYWRKPMLKYERLRVKAKPSKEAAKRPESHSLDGPIHGIAPTAWPMFSITNGVATVRAAMTALEDKAITVQPAKSGNSSNRSANGKKNTRKKMSSWRNSNSSSTTCWEPAIAPLVTQVNRSNKSPNPTHYYKSQRGSKSILQTHPLPTNQECFGRLH